MNNENNINSPNEINQNGDEEAIITINNETDSPGDKLNIKSKVAAIARPILGRIKNSSSLVRFLLIAIIITACAYFAFGWMNANTPSAKNQAASAQVAKQTTAVKSSAPITIDGIEVDESGHEVTMKIELSSGSGFSVMQQASHVSVMINNAELDRPVQLPPEAKQFFDLTSVQKTKQGLYLQFSLKKGLIYESSQSLSKTDIDLTFLSPVSVVSPSDIKKPSAAVDVKNTVKKEDVSNGEAVAGDAVNYQGTDYKDIKTSKLTSEQQMESQYQDILGLFADGKRDEGQGQLMQFVLQHPNFEEARQSLVIVLINNDNIDAAKKILSLSTREFKKDPDFVLLSAYVLSRQGHTQLALDKLHSMAPDVTTTIDYYAFMAVLQLRLDQYHHALTTYQELASADPGNAKWWYGMGVAQRSMGNANAALGDFNRAKQLGDISVGAQAYLGNQLQKMG